MFLPFNLIKTNTPKMFIFYFLQIIVVVGNIACSALPFSFQQQTWFDLNICQMRCKHQIYHGGFVIGIELEFVN